uniref:Anoctamin transmembrane domain-containing protein n=2 Tax=Chrysotila carterae TaxID=13221 RepID=A0A7S4EWD0_CHRCT
MKVKKKQKLTPEEKKIYAEREFLYDVIAEYERPELKSVQQGLDATFYEYNELVIQFGYVIMFSTALPLAALIALVNNLYEVRSDAWKIFKFHRRIRPSGAVNGTGAWRRIIKFLSCVGLATNLLILAYTSDLFDALGLESELARFGAVVAAEHLLVAAVLFIDWVVPDMPEQVKRDLAREQWLAEKRVKRAQQAKAAGGQNARLSPL